MLFKFFYGWKPSFLYALEPESEPVKKILWAGAGQKWTGSSTLIILSKNSRYGERSPDPDSQPTEITDTKRGFFKRNFNLSGMLYYYKFNVKDYF